MGLASRPGCEGTPLSRIRPSHGHESAGPSAGDWPLAWAAAGKRYQPTFVLCEPNRPHRYCPLIAPQLVVRAGVTPLKTATTWKPSRPNGISMPSSVR